MSYEYFRPKPPPPPLVPLPPTFTRPTDQVTPIQALSPAIPVKSRTMQITLPENATHIVICTAANERKEIQLPKFPTVVPPTKQPQLQHLKQPQPLLQQQQQRQLQQVQLPQQQQRPGQLKKLLKPDHSTIPKLGKKSGGRLEHACGECGKKYSTSSNLARHKQTHR